MKGLLLKELYMTLKYYKMSFVIDLMFIVISFVSKENLAFMLFPIIISGVLPVTLLAYDEKFRWTKYSCALPYSAAQIVSAKYLFGIMIQAATSLMIFAAMLLRNGVMAETEISALDSAMMIGGMFVLSLIMPALCLPFCFKFGTEKGRIAYFILIFGLSALIMSFLNASEIPDVTDLPVITALSCLAAVYALSWVISIAIYGGKENKNLYL